MTGFETLSGRPLVRDIPEEEQSLVGTKPDLHFLCLFYLTKKKLNSVDAFAM
jgi:hypothetical protein